MEPQRDTDPANVESVHIIDPSSEGGPSTNSTFFVLSHEEQDLVFGMTTEQAIIHNTERYESRKYEPNDFTT